MAKAKPRGASSAPARAEAPRPATAPARTVASASTEVTPQVVSIVPAPTSLRRQVIFWLLTAAILIAFLYVFSSILLPFLAGMILAYFLDPVADRLEKLGLSRLAATVLILIGFILFEPMGIYGRWIKIRTYFQLFPFYRRDMFRRQRSYLKTERMR
jgi:predicted Na+-dependent transporter